MRGTLILVVAVMLAGEALGHARLTESRPAEGGTLPGTDASISLTFTEPVQPRFSDFALHFLGADPDAAATRDNRLPRQTPSVNRERSLIEVSLPPSSAAGWYLLDWEVLAEDGHTTGGKLRFQIRP